MATLVVQYSNPDPSLSANPDFYFFTQYLITGTNYIIDSKAQVVYLFNPANPGVLETTLGSYAQFEAYLAANPVTSTLPNPNGTTLPPSLPPLTTAQQVYGTFLSNVFLATEAGQCVDWDYGQF